DDWAIDDWDGGRPQTDLKVTLCRQATHRVVGLSPATAAFLLPRCFQLQALALQQRVELVRRHRA
ncbi:MAG: hypothetical protein ABI696_16755, partial [Rubrivivax sp.]